MMLVVHALEDGVRILQNHLPNDRFVVGQVHRRFINVGQDLLDTSVDVARVWVGIMAHNMIDLFIFRVLEEVPNSAWSQVVHEFSFLVLSLRVICIVLRILLVLDSLELHGIIDASLSVLFNLLTNLLPLQAFETL
jgi:hypothetical protein